MKQKLRALKMLFLWRWRLGYWAFDAFISAWNLKEEEDENRSINYIGDD